MRDIVITEILDKTVLSLKNEIENILSEGKAENIVTINLEGKSEIADFMVIASGTSARHTTMLASKLLDKIKEFDPNITSYIEGMAQGEWVLVDTGDIIIHIFKNEIREIYKLEEMWTGSDPSY